jgi:iron(III) transport system permease protein
MNAALIEMARWRPDGWGVISALAAALPLSALVGLVWLAGEPDAAIWAHLWAYVLPQQLTTTLCLMLGVGALSALIGTASAWMVTFYPIKMRRFIGWALLLPLAMPTYLMAYSYGDFLDEAGALYRLWQSVWPATTYPDFRSLPGAVVLLTLALYPYVYISARTAFVQQSALMIEAGRTLGLSPLACFHRLGLPLARPAIIVGVALVLMESMNDIGAVEFLGVNTLTLGVYDTWVVRGNLAGAAQLALTLLAFMAFLLMLERHQRGKSVHYQRAGRQRNLPDFQATPRLIWLMSGFCLVPIVLGFILPVGLLIAHLPAAGWPQGMTQAAVNSVGLAMAAALCATALGLVLAFAARYGRTAQLLLVRLAALGYALPGTVLALGIMTALAFLADASFGVVVLGGSMSALIIAYVVRFLSLSFGTLEAGYGQIAPALDTAARSLGADKNATLRRVHMPLLHAPLVTALLLVFVDVMKELPATLILRPFDFETLATQIYTYASLGQMEDAALPALIILTIGLVPVIFGIGVMERLRRR